MNLKTRAKVVRAMDTMCRCINDEEAFEPWLMVGVADGDITEDTTDEDLEWYCEDENFADLMYYFLRRMKAAQSGGLYVDDVVSKKKED